MHSEELKHRIHIYDNDPNTLDRRKKKQVRDARNGAYKAWRKTLLGNKDLVHAIIQHGLFRMDDIQEFMAVFLDQTKKVRDETSSGEHSAEQNRESLRREAVAARRTLKQAKKLALVTAERDLTSQEWELVQRLDNGKLEEVLKAKERAYGHGTSLPKPMSCHEAILFRVSCNQMDRYWATRWTR